MDFQPLVLTAEIAQRGFALMSELADEHEIETLLSSLEAAHESSGARKATGGVYAMRNVLQIAEVRDFSGSDAVKSVLEPVLGAGFVATRGILFDKTPGANWKVGWHQDLSIAVREKVELPGFGPWTTKAGVTHVQPPREVLEAMLTLRLHLDDCDENNGPLRVLPGSHAHGKMASEEIKAFRQQSEPQICVCPRGGALLMRPLLLHASSPATSPRHRRVLHIEFAAKPLPGGLQWN